MPSLALVAERKYEGKYVALESFTSHRVVASGKKPSTVIKAAEKRGVEEPVVVFIPKRKLAQIL